MDNSTATTTRPGSCMSRLMSTIDLNYSTMPETGKHSLCLSIGYERSLKLTYKSGKTALFMTFEGSYKYSGCFAISLQQYVKLMSIRDDIDKALFVYCNTSYQRKYCRHLGRNLYVRIYSNHGGVELNHYTEYNNTLSKNQQGIELCHAEWLFMCVAYDEVCQFIPQLNEMRQCIDNHTLPDGSLSCEFN
jgi:hypothetical protein